jgi:hypothetical protein
VLKANDLHARDYFIKETKSNNSRAGNVKLLSFIPVLVCAITAPGLPGGIFVSMNRFSTLCG